MIYSLVISPFNGISEVWRKVLLTIGLCAVNVGEFITNMGTVWSEFDERDRRIKEMDRMQQEREAFYQECNKAQQERDRAQQERDRAETRHLQNMEYLRSITGQTNTAIASNVDAYKQRVFNEHKQIIADAFHRSIQSLNVTTNYEPIEHVTPRELMQCQLSNSSSEADA